MNVGRDALALARERFAARDYHGVVLLLEEADREGALYPDALNLLALALAMIDRPADALAALDRALAQNPRYIEAHLNRAVVLGQLGREEEARDAHAEARALDEADETGFPVQIANQLANGHASLGDAYRAAGALRQATEQYERALGLRPAFADIRIKLARVLLEAGDPSGAVAAADAALETRPGLLDGMLLRGLGLYLQGDLAGAGATWDAAEASHPGEPRLAIYRSMLARRRSGGAGAVEDGAGSR